MLLVHPKKGFFFGWFSGWPWNVSNHRPHLRRPCVSTAWPFWRRTRAGQCRWQTYIAMRGTLKGTAMARSPKGWGTLKNAAVICENCVFFQLIYRDGCFKGVIMNKSIFLRLWWSTCPYCVSHSAIVFGMISTDLALPKLQGWLEINRPLTATHFGWREDGLTGQLLI